MKFYREAIKEKENYLANTRQIIEKLTSKGFAGTSSGATRKQQVEETEVENLLRTSEDENVALRQRWALSMMYKTFHG